MAEVSGVQGGQVVLVPGDKLLRGKNAGTIGVLGVTGDTPKPVCSGLRQPGQQTKSKLQVEVHAKRPYVQ